MFSNVRGQSGVPIVQVVVSLTAVAVLMVWATLLLASRWESDGVLKSAILFAGIVSWGAALIGLLPVAMVGLGSAEATVRAYFVGMGGRWLFCALGGLFGALVLDLSVEPMLLGLVGFYVPLLFVEAALVGRCLWLQDSLSTRTNTR